MKKSLFILELPIVILQVQKKFKDRSLALSNAGLFEINIRVIVVIETISLLCPLAIAAIMSERKLC